MSSIGYNSIAKCLVMLVQLWTSAILARNLNSADYGVVGIAMVIIGFFNRFSDMGVQAALIRRPDLDESFIRTARALNLYIAVALFILAVCFAPISAYIFRNSSVPPVVMALSITFLISTLGFLPCALLTREMRFAELRMPTVAGALVRGLVAVSCAWGGLKYWSLVAGNLAGLIMSSALFRVIRPVPCKWQLNAAIAKEILRFGLPLCGTGLLAFACLNLDNFVIASFAGAAQLGFYTVALTWGTYSSSAVSEIVHSVLFPRMSQLQNNRPHLKVIYLRSLRIIMFGTILINSVLFAAASNFLITVLGKGSLRWAPAIGCLQALCVYGILRAATEPLGNVVLALGKPAVMFRAALLVFVCDVCALPFVVKSYGIFGVAIVMSAVYVLQWIIYAPFLRTELGVSLSELLKIAAPCLFSAVLVLGISEFLTPTWSHNWGTLFLKAAVVSIIFCIAHECLSRGAILNELLTLPAVAKWRGKAIHV